MRVKMKEDTTVFILFIVLVFIISLFVFDTIFTENKQTEQIQAQQTEIAVLKDKVYWLRQADQILPLIEQILTPQQMAEARLLAEQIRQGEK